MTGAGRFFSYTFSVITQFVWKTLIISLVEKRTPSFKEFILRWSGSDWAQIGHLLLFLATSSHFMTKKKKKKDEMRWDDIKLDFCSRWGEVNETVIFYEGGFQREPE